MFSLDPKEGGGRAQAALKLRGQPLTQSQNPTFLGIKFDTQLTSDHITDLNKMSRRRQCLLTLAGKSYGSHRRTIRAAYVGYVRSLFDYGAAVYRVHAAPSVRDKLEAEQHKCARIITGCIRLTHKGALLAEADLVPLSLRAKQLAVEECQRTARLPDGDPTKNLLSKTPNPRLKYRAHEA